jgi:hypothetical protein
MENENLEIENRTNDTNVPIQNEQLNETEHELGILPSPFCEGRCGVCDSGFAVEINALRPTKTLIELSEFLKNEYAIELSKDQLHWHFKKYGLKLRQHSTIKAYTEFSAAIDLVAEHQKQTLFLAQYTFEEILRRIASGTLKVDISDYEKLIKLHYQILQAPELAPQQGLVETFLLAQRRFNVPISQQSFDFSGTPPQEASVDV